MLTNLLFVGVIFLILFAILILILLFDIDIDFWPDLDYFDDPYLYIMYTDINDWY